LITQKNFKSKGFRIVRHKRFYFFEILSPVIHHPLPMKGLHLRPIPFYMKSLFLIRHAKSSWDTPGLRDFDRPLNERGLHEAPMMAQLLLQKGFKPDLLVSSPAKRAISTAKFFAHTFGIQDEAIVRQPSIYEASVRDILEIISNLPDAADVVLIFGHNPTFTDVANRFADDFIDNVPTAGIVYMESDAERWAEFYEVNTHVKGKFFPKEIF
jgi:phosphohistidine phosphatase